TALVDGKPVEVDGTELKVVYSARGTLSAVLQTTRTNLQSNYDAPVISEKEALELALTTKPTLSLTEQVYTADNDGAYPTRSIFPTLYVEQAGDAKLVVYVDEQGRDYLAYRVTVSGKLSSDGSQHETFIYLNAYNRN